ncbi:amino acid adenylation domain-containing protein [Candidatus Frankia nodulisporulans]|uniref:amino acid adenylation domain-containing protein n=2 Tax=Candidatus Frankia nodulisporulans TaxID=2060052 RepID=UPI0013D83981|nr:amino acid adenylation domain-containing protein [Candidatus Frankia nodulisporulans]
MTEGDDLSAAIPSAPLSAAAVTSAAAASRSVGWGEAPWCVRWIRDHAVRRPTAVSVVDDPAAAATTYGELWAGAARVAAALRELGPRAGVSSAGVSSAGTVVAVAADRGTPFITAALGCWLAGVAYLPLDPAHPRARLRRVCADAAAVAVLCSASQVGLGADLGLPEIGPAQLAAARTEPDMPAPSAPDGCANVIYTSGTTGVPKGVEVGHAGLANLVRWHQRAYPIRPGDRYLHTLSLGFDAAGFEIWPTLAAGATLLACPDDVRMVSGRIVETLRAWRASLTTLATPIAEQVLAGPGLVDLPDLRRMFTGGAQLRLPAPAPAGGRLVNVYGPTETSIVATTHPVLAGGAGDRPAIGRPIDGFEILLLDDAGVEVPAGEPGASGEVYIGGAGVALGYRGDPATTAARFVTVSGRAGRWYRSGDLARWQDGELHYLGRRDGEQLKVRGMRVEAGEIEAALMALPGITAAAVAVVGHGADSDLVALTVPAVTVPAVTVPAVTGTGPGGGWDTARLRGALAGVLPAGLIPTVCAPVAALPLTTNGKLDRARVAELAAATPRGAESSGRTPSGPVTVGVPRQGTPVGSRAALLYAEPITEW